jgi:hypothetical protein
VEPRPRLIRRSALMSGTGPINEQAVQTLVFCVFGAQR